MLNSNESTAGVGPHALDNDEANMVSSLTKKVKITNAFSHPALTPSKVRDLEAELQRRDASYAELCDLNQNLEMSCKDLEKSVQDIQPKYQEALNDRGRFEHEMMESASREKILQQRLDLRLLELTKLREERIASDAELSAARASLSSSAIPQVAEINQMAANAQTARQENERLQKRIANMQNELEYMRTNYQQASSAAGEAVSELDDAQRKASDNARRIHEFQASSEIKQHLARIAELEAGKAEAERELDKKSDELRALLNGRRTTRGTSVPRSPRMGTMSPGSRPMVRVLSVGSRGTSPAPGDGPPYRGTFASEALFTAAPGSGRWGNHLV
jgi:chromosome segregation ATPase